MIGSCLFLCLAQFFFCYCPSRQTDKTAVRYKFAVAEAERKLYASVWASAYTRVRWDRSGGGGGGTGLRTGRWPAQHDHRSCLHLYLLYPLADVSLPAPPRGRLVVASSGFSGCDRHWLSIVADRANRLIKPSINQRRKSDDVDDNELGWHTVARTHRWFGGTSGASRGNFWFWYSAEAGHWSVDVARRQLQLSIDLRQITDSAGR